MASLPCCMRKKLESSKHNAVTPDSSIWKKANFGQDVIIANLDTGVWPESRSFADDNMGPVPKRYKGACENEMIPPFIATGARYFYKGFAELLREHNMTFNYAKSPRDTEGHGTHTLSTAGGNPVQGVNINGFGNGTAVGGSQGPV
ncbi:Subtilisin-like protease SBT5.3 [Bienertia sinuspersici]